MAFIINFLADNINTTLTFALQLKPRILLQKVSPFINDQNNVRE